MITFPQTERVENYNIDTGFPYGPFPKLFLRVGQIRQIDVFDERTKTLSHFAAEIIKAGVYDCRPYWICMAIDYQPSQLLFSVSDDHWVHWALRSSTTATARIGKNMPWRRKAFTKTLAHGTKMC